MSSTMRASVFRYAILDINQPRFSFTGKLI